MSHISDRPKIIPFNFPISPVSRLIRQISGSKIIKTDAMTRWYGHRWHCEKCIHWYSGSPENLCGEGITLLDAAIDSYSLITAVRGNSENKPAQPDKKSRKLNFRKSPEDFSEPVNSENADLQIKDAANSILPAVAGQQEFLVDMLNGSQKKTAFAIRMNAEKMIRDYGVNSTGFLTLTVGDYFCHEHGKQIPNTGENNSCPCCGNKMFFKKIYDAAEASRRFNNLNRRILPLLVERGIVVSERHKDKGIHFHMLAILKKIGAEKNFPDIRTSFDFEAFDMARAARKKGWTNYHAESRYKMAASESLRSRWEFLREVLPKYGFGRAELTPVKKTGEAIACYISKYIEKNVCNRTPDDKRKKLVRYLGWNKKQLKPNEFEWNGKKAEAWRGKARELVGMFGGKLPDKDFNLPEHVTDFCFYSFGQIRQKMLDGSEAKELFGARWAYHVHEMIKRFSDQPVPFMVIGILEREVIFHRLSLSVDRRAYRELDNRKPPAARIMDVRGEGCEAFNLPDGGAMICGEKMDAKEFAEFCLPFSKN